MAPATAGTYTAPSLMAGTKEMAMDMEGKIKLGKIEVKMGEKAVSLSIEQARELCALLKGLFGDDTTKIIHTSDYWYWRPWYAGPQWTYNGSNWNMTVDDNGSTLNANKVYTVNLCSTRS